MHAWGAWCIGWAGPISAVSEGSPLSLLTHGLASHPTRWLDIQKMRFSAACSHPQSTPFISPLTTKPQVRVGAVSEEDSVA